MLASQLLMCELEANSSDLMSSEIAVRTGCHC
jgi:hypothetical protein